MELETHDYKPGDVVTVVSRGAHFLKVGTEARVIDDAGHDTLMVYGTTIDEFGGRKAPQFVSVDEVKRSASQGGGEGREYERGDQVLVHERAYHRYPPETVATVERSWLDDRDNEVLLLKAPADELPDDSEQGLGQFVLARDVELYYVHGDSASA